VHPLAWIAGIGIVRRLAEALLIGIGSQAWTSLSIDSKQPTLVSRQ
jgi:hypothetical protein